MTPIDKRATRTKRLVVPLSLIVAFGVPLAVSAEDEEVAQDAAELRVLSNYIGTWDVVAGSKDAPAAEGSNEGSTEGSYVAKWILAGRFVQTTGSIKAADGSSDVEVTTLMTYDRDKKTYRTWAFISNGHTSESEGTWNPNTRTMTRITRYGDITQTTTSIFAEPGIETWTMVSKDRDDKVVGEMRGTNARRKK